MKWAISLVAGFGFIALGWRLLDSRWFSWLLPTFFVVNCLFLIIVVLLQSGKAADIAGAFGGAGSQTAFGPRGAATVLSRATTWCAVMFMVCALGLLPQREKSAEQGGSVLEKFSTPAPEPAPVARAKPQTTPQSTAPQSSTPQSSAPTSSAPAPATQQPVPAQPKKP